jgi:GxxExxY protein
VSSGVPNKVDHQVHRIIRAGRRVHADLGPGFVESIYSRAMMIELRDSGFRVEREKLIRVWYRNMVAGRHYVDIVIDGEIILELKAGRGILPLHSAQVRSYLQASRYTVGLILNFGTSELEWERINRLGDDD